MNIGSCVKANVRFSALCDIDAFPADFSFVFLILYLIITDLYNGFTLSLLIDFEVLSSTYVVTSDVFSVHIYRLFSLNVYK